MTTLAGQADLDGCGGGYAFNDSDIVALRFEQRPLFNMEFDKSRIRARSQRYILKVSGAMRDGPPVFKAASFGITQSRRRVRQ